MTYELLTVMLSSIGIAWLSQKVATNRRNLLGGKVPNFLGIAVVAAIMLLYSGMRNNIGDTVYYIHAYHLLEEDLVRPEFGFEDWLFRYIRYLLLVAGANYSWLIAICAAGFLIPAVFTLAKYSCQFELAIYLFFAMAIYTSSMNGIRQYFATGIVLLATPFLFSPKKWHFIPFALIVGVAFLIHTSSIIMIIIYFVSRRKAWSVPTFAIIIAAFGALFFITQFSSSFFALVDDTSYTDYQDEWFYSGNEKGANILRVLVNCVPMGLSMLFSKKLRKLGPVVDILINMSVVHASIYVISLYNWIFARFAFYTCVYVIILMVLIAKTSLSNGVNKSIFYLMIALFAVYMLYENKVSMFYTYDSEWFTPRGAIPFLV